MTAEHEKRIANLEATVATLSELIAALVGGQQALLCGLRVAIMRIDPSDRPTELERLLAESEAFLQGLPIADAPLDQASIARRDVAVLIHAEMIRAAKE